MLKGKKTLVCSSTLHVGDKVVLCKGQYKGRVFGKIIEKKPSKSPFAHHVKIDRDRVDMRMLDSRERFVFRPSLFSWQRADMWERVEDYNK